jgi:hypothetical protein
MPNAWVIEVKADNTEHQHGLFEFAQIPITGDRIALGTADRAMHAFGVVQIEHYPAPTPPRDAPKEPSAAIYVTWLNEVAPK